ncbi:hypothetical protein EDC64_10772 [Aquabacter spiritensis]|uniref:Uncharacterized protein n=1 Tax=Aquabacter spiritensis TaxID=933073 RepID=A0A4R3LVY4_9HYPH|nr:hypothetical protein EDC64_10772 [Aquabacter spiritensis]
MAPFGPPTAEGGPSPNPFPAPALYARFTAQARLRMATLCPAGRQTLRSEPELVMIPDLVCLGGGLGLFALCAVAVLAADLL